MVKTSLVHKWSDFQIPSEYWIELSTMTSKMTSKMAARESEMSQNCSGFQMHPTFENLTSKSVCHILASFEFKSFLICGLTGKLLR